MAMAAKTGNVYTGIYLRKYYRLYQHSYDTLVVIYGGRLFRISCYFTIVFLARLSFNCVFNFYEVIQVRLCSFFLADAIRPVGYTASSDITFES